MLQTVRAQTHERVERPRAIAVMIGQLSQGGTERQLYMFLAHCDQTRWAPVLYVSGELGFWEEPIRRLGIPIVLLRGNQLAKMWQFRAACIAQDAKCFFSWSSYTNGYGLALTGRDIRRIGSFRSALFGDLPARQHWLWSWMSVAGISTAVCNSRATEKQIGIRRSATRAVYVPNAIRTFASEQIRTWRAQWRARLGLQDKEILVLGVGRLEPVKDFARFIDVISHVSRLVPVHAVIAGEDRGCLSDLQDQVERLGLQATVRLIGKVPDARELMCAGDIFLLTSEREGMPNVVLEAMAAGVPCVVTKIDGTSNLIQHGTTGFVAERDVSELAGYVARLAMDGDLRRGVGPRARAMVEREYQPEHVARQLWALCE